MKCFSVITWEVLILAQQIGIQNQAAASDCVPPTYSPNLSQERFLEQLTSTCRYDKYTIPESNIPLNVAIKIDLKHIAANQTQFIAHLMVELTYEDQRLNYENLTTTKSVIFGGAEMKEKIWTPRLQLDDQTDTTVLGSEEKNSLVLIDKTGFVTYSYRLVVKFYCWMDLQKFPFDCQKCSLSFSDSSYNNNQLQLFWNIVPFSTSVNSLHLTGFVVDDIEYTSGDTYQGRTSSVSINFKFHRNSGYYLLTLYVSSCLLISTAWITFWLQADAGPPRVILGTSTVIAFVTLHLGLSKDIPKVSYVKACDVWFLGVSCFIFFSLAEFAFVNVIWRRKKIIELRKPTLKYILKSALRPSQSREDLRRYESKIAVIDAPQYDFSKSLNQGTLAVDQTVIPISEKKETLEFNWTTMTPHELAIYIDRKARMVFPICFVMFNLIYWVYVYF